MVMRRVLKIALATGALGLAAAGATPAWAAVTVVGPAATVDSCANFTFNTPPTETKCAGGYSGNLISGTAMTNTTGLAALAALGYSGTGTYLASISPIGTGTATINFGQTLVGLTIIGLHYGSAGDGGEGTSFFLFDAGSGVNSVTVSSRTNTNFNFGLSNAALFSTTAVPEPATWAMMLLGFGGIGMAMRRRRRPAMMQIA